MEERRSEDRRDEDMRLAGEVQALLEHERKQNGERFAEKGHVHQEILRLIEVIEGKSTVLPSGRVIYEGGLLDKGGSIPVAGWVAIVVAIIAGLFNVWAALVTTMPWG